MIINDKVVYNVDDFPYYVIKQFGIQKRRRGNQGKRNNRRKYKNVFCAFDIEATNDFSIDNAYMYIWQFQISDLTVVGRTWDDFLLFLKKICEQLEEEVYLMIYVHNLSYEFSFLKGVYDFESEEVFSVRPRKVLKCEMFDHFEFRCSYLLTNMSLAEFTKKMGCTEKLSGDDFDYSVLRYPWTELTDSELMYCIVDVISLVEALEIYFSIEHDNFYTIPLTSTGFVRRDVKKAMRHYNKDKLNNILPDYEVFCLLREAFRGGNTHANRYYIEQIVENVASYDRVSSYPDVQINDLFPMGSWIYEENADFDRVIRKIYKQKRAGLIRVSFNNIRLKNPLWGCPYIPKHKCRNLDNYYNDNGRILYADYLEITVTDIDLKIILDEYNFDSAAVLDFYHCRYGKLPKPLRDTVKYYFQQKTELKNVAGSELYYMLSKAKLNSIYGMSVQSPVKQNITYINDTFVEETEPENELLDKSNKKAFLSYAWGVWTTARAREQLEIAIKLVGNNFVYCDTDSVKFIKDDFIDFSDYNYSREKESEKNGGVATDLDGNKYYLGIYEVDGIYKKFVTMGAKKYCYIDENNNLGLTVAGVAKKKGAIELLEHGGIEQFKEGFCFHAAGGTESVYNDKPEYREYFVGDKKIDLVSNVMIKPSTYTLGITGDYRRIISKPQIWLDLLR